MLDSYDQPEQPRGRPEYRTGYRGISAHDEAFQANYNSAGDRRSYRKRSVSRDRIYRRSKRSQKHGGNTFALINISHNSLLGTSKDRSWSTSPNRALSDFGNDRLEQIVDRGRRWIDEEDVVSIEHAEIKAEQSKKHRQRPRKRQSNGVDAPRNRRRASKEHKTGLVVALLTAVVSIFVIAKSLPKREPPFEGSRGKALASL